MVHRLHNRKEKGKKEEAMKLYEYEGKRIFRKEGIPVPRSVLVLRSETQKNIPFKECVLKAQVLHGKRKKQGLIAFAESKLQAKSILSAFFKKKGIKSVLVEEKIPIKKEIYLSFTINPSLKSVVCLFSLYGGIDIEELSQKFPERIIRFAVNGKNVKKEMQKALNSMREKGVPKKEILNVAIKLYGLMKKHDAELVEINPLALTKNGKSIALDSKVVLDDNALFRHKEFEPLRYRELSGLELEAQKQGIHFVEAEGDIGIVSDGAGIVMATMDTVYEFGGKPAFFLDLGGGADTEKAEKALRIAMKKKMKALFIDIFGGITHCDEIARAVLKIKKEIDGKKIRLIVRVAGTSEEQAEEMLRKENITLVSSMEEGARKACQF